VIRTRLRSQAGFSLTELLVTLAVLGLIMGAVFTVQLAGNSAFTAGSDLAESQQTARTAMLIDEDLRLVGYGYLLSTPAIVAASATSVSFWADLVNASTFLTADLAAGGTTLTVATSAGLSVGDTIYLVNGKTEATLTINAVPDTTSVRTAAGVGADFPRGAMVGRARRITYTWVVGILTRDGGDGAGAQTLATGVQSLQLGYFDVNDAPIAAANLAANLGNIRRVTIAVTAQSASPGHARAFNISSNIRPRNL